MEALRQYVISVTAAALVVAIFTAMFDKNSGTGKMVRLIGSLMLTLVVIGPLVRLDFDKQVFLASGIGSEVTAAVDRGEKLAREEAVSIIKTRMEAYILDKATSMSADISADVTVGEDGVPCSAVIRGEVSPAAKMRLRNILETDLGISKENQVWIGRNVG